MAATSQRAARKFPSNASPSGRTLQSTPGQCIVCRRSNVDLHPYTSSQTRLFCRRDHDIAEAMRTMGYSMTSQPDATTAVAQRHLRLIEWLEDKLSARDVAAMVIYAEYRELPRR